MVVKQEREDARKEEFEAENMRRALKGLPLEEWVEDEDIDEDLSESLVSSDSEVIEPEENEEDSELEEDDPLILESGRILADYINLNGRRVSSVNN